MTKENEIGSTNISGIMVQQYKNPGFTQNQHQGEDLIIKKSQPW